MGDLVAAAVTLILYGGLFIGGELLYRRFSIDPETTRKITHVGGGLIALLLPSLFSNWQTVALLGVIFALVLTLTRRRHLVKSVHDVRRNTIGEILFPLGLAATFAITSIAGRPELYPIPILILTLGDTAAWLVGRSFGRHLYHPFGDTKSLEGSLGIGITAAVITMIGLTCATVSGGTGYHLVITLLTGLIAALLEAFSPRGFDNLTLPVGTLAWLLMVT